MSCAWRQHIVAMTGNRTEGRGTLSRTWRGALNAGIRAEGADDKLAHTLRPNRLAPFMQADLGPSTNRPQHRCETRNESAGQANIERLRETDLRDRRRNGTAGNGAHRPAQDRKVDSLAGIRQSSSHGRVTHRDLRGQLASRVRALVLAEGSNSRSGVARWNSRVDLAHRVSRAQKKRRSEERRPSRITTGANQIRPES